MIKNKYGLAAFVLLFLITSLSARVRFKDVSYEKKVRGFFYQGGFCYGHGIAFADINNDSLPDMYVSNAMRMDAARVLPELLYMSQRGGPYTEEAVERGLEDRYWDTGSHGIVFTDIDNDGDYDVFNGTTDIKNRIYQNDGLGFFTDISDNILYNGETYITRRGTRGVCAFDANSDGFMDLYAVNWRNARIEDDAEPHEFYLNNGDGTFMADPDNEYGLTGKDMVRIGEGVQGISAIDVDNDGDIDVYISRRNYGSAVYDAHNQLMINDGTGHFTDKTRERGVYYERTDAYFNNSNGSTFADYDNDGDLDLFLANTIKLWKQDMKIFENQGDGHFIDVTDVHKIPQDGFSVLLFDMNNDTDLDMMVLPYSGRADWVEVKVFLNDGNGRFNYVSGTGAEVRVIDPRAGAVADVDDDGDLDVYFVDANKGRDSGFSNHLLENRTDDGYNWIKIFGRGPKGDMGAFGSKVWVFKAGHMNDMEHLIGYKQIQSAYGYISQDDPVQHFGLRDRDSCDVKVQLLDGSVFQTYSAPAKIRLFFTKPSSLVKTGGDDQTGFIGSALDKPLSVRIISDDKSEHLAGVPLHFTVLSGGGSFLSNQEDTLTIYSNLQGEAKLYYIPGSESIEQIVKVQSPMLPDRTLTFTCHLMAEGPALLKRDEQFSLQGTAGSFLSDSVRYQVQNGFGEGQAGHPVTFRIASGNGKLNHIQSDSLTVVSGDSGYAAVAWKLGPSVSMVNELIVESKNEGRHLLNSPDTLRLFAQPGEPVALFKYDGDDQNGFINQALGDSLVVNVYDQFNNPVPGTGVYFQVQSGAGRVGMDSLYRAVSNQSGLARCEWTLGPIAGLEQNVIAYLPDQPELFVTFTATAKHPNAYEVVCLNDTPFRGNRNTAIRDSIIIAVKQQGGQPVKNFAIFAEADDNGLINGKHSLTLITDDQGIVQFEWKLGSKTGEQAVTVTAGTLQGSPLRLTAQVESRSPVVLQLLSQDTYTIAPDSALSGPIQIQVTDSLGYAIYDHPVDFEIIKGDANFNGNAEITLSTDPYGFVSPDLSTNNQAGQILIKVTGMHQNVHLTKSPLYISVYIVGKHPSLSHSMIEATSPHVANGSDSSRIVVTIRDKYDNPVPDAKLDLNLNSEYPVISIRGDSATNEYGQLVAFCKSLVAGKYKLWPLYENQPATADSAILVFKPGAPHHLAAFSPTQMEGFVCQYLDSTLVFAVVDSFDNPVTDHKVDIQIQLPDSQKTEPVMLQADEQGLFHYSWQMSDQPGQHFLEVRYKSFDPLVFTATAVLPIPATIDKINGDNQAGLSNTLLLQPLHVCVKDENDKPLCRIPVQYALQSGSGSFYQSSCDTTDREGKAKVSFMLGDSPGEGVIHALAQGLAMPAEFSFTIQPYQVAQLRIAGGNDQGGRPGTTLPDPLVVQVMDDRNQPVKGKLVKFRVLSGGGTLCTVDSAFSNREGKVTCCWQLGTQGEQILQAWVADDESIEAEFHASLSENTTPTIVCPADTSVEENQLLAFTITASDADGDSVALLVDHLPDGAQFDSTTGHFSWRPDWTQQGEYTLHLQAIDQYGAMKEKQLVITVLNKNRPAHITYIFPADSLLSITATDPVYFEIKASDPDQDSLLFRWFIDDSLAHHGSDFNLDPTTKRDGHYRVRVRVSDGTTWIDHSWYLDVRTKVIFEGEVPVQYALMQNYPNPFNPQTTIPFAVPKATWINISVYNASGQRIRTLANGFYQRGSYRVVWNSCDDSGMKVPTGTYYYRMKTDEFDESRKLVLIK